MGDRARLVVLSFLMLFVELALIRWTGSNVVYLSYFSNFVLLGSFLGIGLGFLLVDRRRDLFALAPVALAALVVFVGAFPVEINRSGAELIYFGVPESTGLPTWVTLPVIFVAVAAVMATIAHGVAEVFVRFEPLEAYRLDVIGAIAGIACFTLLSFLRAPPIVWGVIAGVVFATIFGRAIRLVQVVAILAVIVALLDESLTSTLSWSPYYKVATVKDPSSSAYAIGVNGIPHQMINSNEERRRSEPIYFLPYERVESSDLDRVLVVGAGNGGDVAIALEKGADHVDAVEIDPRLYEIGAELNPERPYHDQRVDVHIDDGRAFLEQSQQRYDLILFALPDSLTLVAGQSSLRLESYLFTQEALRQAKSHLTANGTFAMYNYYRERWLLDRLAGTLEEVFGHRPCVDIVGSSGHLALLSIGRDPGAIDCPRIWQPAGDVPPPATDDRPFLYLRSASIPSFYLLTIGLILLLSVAAVRWAVGSLRSIVRYSDLFFMGAAFLLLETKSIIQFALLFGTTWVVNALVFAGILLSVLAAVEVARRIAIPNHVVLYAALFVAFAVAWAVPPSALLDLAVTLRFLAGVTLAFTPIFLANLVFAERFKHTRSSATAFGANLLGAMIGGLVEYSALVIGYRSILIVAALLYFMAFISRPRLAGLVGRPAA